MGKIIIDGVIGLDITPRFIRSLLDQEKNEKETTVEINSPGGFVFEGY